MPRLHLLSGDSITASIDLTVDLLTIGRTENNGLCIEDSSISESHGILVRDEADYQIHDFNSTNGTRVNGEKIMAVKLKHGDRVHIGLVELKYEAVVAPAAPAGPKIKLGTGAKQVAVSGTVVAPPEPPATPPARTLGGQPVAPPTPAPEPPPPPPAKPKKGEERVFIRLPDSAAAEPPKPPPPPTPEPVAPPSPSPAAVPVEEVAEQPLAQTPAPPAEDRPLTSPTTAPRGEVSLRTNAPTATGEKKISLKPQQAPRETLRFGPKKKE